MDAKKLGAFIASTRKAQGMTQSELAAKLYVSDKTISKWERGAGFPDIKNLEPLASALGISLVELMQAERNTEEFIRTQAAEKIIADTITIRTSMGLFGRLVGTIILVIFFCIVIWMLQTLLRYGSGVLIPVSSIVLGLAAWSIPIWSMVYNRAAESSIHVWISMSLAALSVGIQFFMIYGYTLARAWSSIEDTIHALVLVVLMFLAISISLNGIMLWKHRRH